MWILRTRSGEQLNLRRATYGRAHRVEQSASCAWGDTIVGTVRPGNGSYSFVGTNGLTGSTGFAVLRPTHPRYREFVYLAVTKAENIERLALRADGAAYPAVRPNVVSETKIVVPGVGTDLLGYLSTFVAPMLNAMEANKSKTRTLAAQREALLPKLVSGELQVRDVAAFMENTS